VIVKKMAVLTITIMTRGCESKQAHSRCQSHQQNRIIFGNDYNNMRDKPTITIVHVALPLVPQDSTLLQDRLSNSFQIVIKMKNGTNLRRLPVVDLDVSAESIPLPLHGIDSPFIKPIQTESQLPRALRSLAQIVDNDLCHRCGSCVGICPTNVLSCSSDEYPVVTNLAACTDCDLCVRVCPGDEFDYAATQKEMFNNTDVDEHKTHGEFKKAVLAHATDSELQKLSTSGGLVTATILGMMAAGQADGAVCLVSDEKTLWKGKVIIARNRTELFAALKSKYAITATNAIFSEIIATPGRYVFVGLPCQIHGLHKAMQLNKVLKERIVLTIALFCHAAIDHEGFRVIWETLPPDIARRAVRYISRVGKHPGSPCVELDDGTLYPVYFGHKKGYRPTSIEMINMLYRLYTPKRCLTCFDALGEFADIAVGDPWMAPPEKDIIFKDGWSFGLYRTDRALECLELLKAQGDINVREVTRNEALDCNKLMAEEKRLRARRTINNDLDNGSPVPEYHLVFSAPRGVEKLKSNLNAFTHYLCFCPGVRNQVLKFLLSEWGYPLLYLNRQRRLLKFRLRDLKARIKQNIFGRR
jgi:coenzyme F420 hydrogenase subunit beta